MLEWRPTLLISMGNVIISCPFYKHRKALYNLSNLYMIFQYLLCEQSIPLYCRWQTHFPFSQVPWPLQLFGQLEPFLFLPITALIVRELESSLNTPICQSPLDKSLTTVTISLLLRETALSYRGWKEMFVSVFKELFDIELSADLCK